MYQEQPHLVITTCPEDQLLILLPQKLCAGSGLSLHEFNIHGFTPFRGAAKKVLSLPPFEGYLF